MLEILSVLVAVFFTILTLGYLEKINDDGKTCAWKDSYKYLKNNDGKKKKK